MTNKTKALLIERQAGICTLILNRPEKHNAFDDHLIDELNRNLASLSQDDTIRVIVLRANGKHFSAGADLAWMARMADYNEAENLADSKQLAQLMYQLSHTPKVTIALVQGGAFGGGAGLVAACDIAIASEKARFCFSEVKLGLIPAVISPYVIAAMGQRAARRYFLSAEVFSSEQALHHQLIHQCVDSDTLLDTGMTLACQIANLAPKALSDAKDLIELVSHREIDRELIDETARRIAKTRISSEGQEGLKAFLEKRPPNWEKQ